MATTKVTSDESVMRIVAQGVPASVAITTNTFTTFNTITIPTTPVAHNYLVIASVEFANASGGTSNEFALRILNNSAVEVMIQYHDCHAGTYFTTSTINYVHQASGGVITLQAYSQAAGRATNGRGRYTVIDLGPA